MEVKKCVVCGRVLTGQQIKYCSKKCGNKGASLAKKGEIEQIRQVCPICGKVFYNNLRKYCSYDCTRISVGNVKRKKYNNTPYIEAFGLKKPTEPKTKRLSWADVIKGMEETGLSYGEYIARYDNE